MPSAASIERQIWTTGSWQIDIALVVEVDICHGRSQPYNRAELARWRQGSRDCARLGTGCTELAVSGGGSARRGY